jgi:hypothetical protein
MRIVVLVYLNLERAYASASGLGSHRTYSVEHPVDFTELPPVVFGVGRPDALAFGEMFHVNIAPRFPTAVAFAAIGSEPNTNSLHCSAIASAIPV